MSSPESLDGLGEIVNPRVNIFFPLYKPVCLQDRKSENVSVLVIMDP